MAAPRAVGFQIVPVEMFSKIPCTQIYPWNSPALSANEACIILYEAHEDYEMQSSTAIAVQRFSSAGAQWTPYGPGAICLNDKFCCILSGNYSEMLLTRPSGRQFFSRLPRPSLEQFWLRPHSVAYNFPYILICDYERPFMAMIMGESMRIIGKSPGNRNQHSNAMNVDTSSTNRDGLISDCSIGRVQACCIYYDKEKASEALFLIAEPKAIRVVSTTRVETMSWYIPSKLAPQLHGWPSNLCSIAMDNETKTIFVVDSVHASVVSIRNDTVAIVVQRSQQLLPHFSPEFVSLGCNKNIVVREKDGNIHSFPIEPITAPSSSSMALASSREYSRTLFAISADIWGYIADFFDSLDLLRLQNVNHATRSILKGRTRMHIRTNRIVNEADLFGPYLERAPYLDTFEFTSTHTKPLPLFALPESSAQASSSTSSSSNAPPQLPVAKMGPQRPWQIPPLLTNLTLNAPISLDNPTVFSTLQNLTTLQLPQLDRAPAELIRALPHSLVFLSLPSAVPGVSLLKFPPNLQYLDIRRMQLGDADVPSPEWIKRDLTRGTSAAGANEPPSEIAMDVTDDEDAEKAKVALTEEEKKKYVLLPELRILNIAAATLHDSQLCHLPPNLTELNLSLADNITDDGIRNLPRCIQRLHIGSTRYLTDQCAADLPPKLRALNVNHNPSLTDQFFAALAGIPSIASRLEELQARDSSMTIFSVPLLSAFINLVDFKPSRAFTKDLKLSLLPLLPRNLKHLDLSFNRILTLGSFRDEESKFTGNFEDYFPPELTSLVYGQDPTVRDEEFQFFPRTLKTLDLGRCGAITPAGLARLKNQTPMLESLDISDAANLEPQHLEGLPNSLTSIELPIGLLNAMTPTNFDFITRYNLKSLKLTSRAIQLDSSIFWMIPRTVTDFEMPYLRKVLPIHVPCLPPNLTNLVLSGVEDLTDEAICTFETVEITRKDGTKVQESRWRGFLSHLLVTLDLSSCRHVTPVGIQGLHLLRTLELGVDDTRLSQAATKLPAEPRTREAVLALLPRHLRYLTMPNFPGLRIVHLPHLNELLHLVSATTMHYAGPPEDTPQARSFAQGGDAPSVPAAIILRRIALANERAEKESASMLPFDS